MAAQVEMKSVTGERAEVTGTLRFDSLADSDSKRPVDSSMDTPGHLIPEPGKPGTKPRFTPKPFSPNLKQHVRPIMAPKPLSKPKSKLEHTTSTPFQPCTDSSELFQPEISSSDSCSFTNEDKPSYAKSDIPSTPKPNSPDTPHQNPPRTHKPASAPNLDMPSTQNTAQIITSSPNLSSVPKPDTQGTPKPNPSSIAKCEPISTPKPNLISFLKTDSASVPKPDLPSTAKPVLPISPKPKLPSTAKPVISTPKPAIVSVAKPDLPSTVKPDFQSTPKPHQDSTSKPNLYSTPKLDLSLFPNIDPSSQTPSNKPASPQSPDEPIQLTVSERVKRLLQSQSSQKSSAAEWSGITQQEKDQQQERQRYGRKHKGSTSISRTKSMGFLDRVGWEVDKDGDTEKETEDDKKTSIVWPRRNRSFMGQSPVSQNQTSLSPTTSSHWSERQPLSSNLKCKFEPLSSALQGHEDKQKTLERRTEDTSTLGSAEKEQVTELTTPTSLDSALKQAAQDGMEGGKEKTRNQEKAGTSIKRRISLLFDSPSQGGGATDPEVEPHPSAQPIPEVDILVGVKQRIKLLTGDTTSHQTTAQRTQLKPRPLSQDLTKYFSAGASTETGSPTTVSLERAGARDSRGDREPPRKLEDSSLALTPEQEQENQSILEDDTERQKELELERQKQMKLELELERQREAERQKQLELERQKQLELERQREAERQKQLELERQKQLELERQQEAERQKQMELERQKQLELERQREAERQKQMELERQREAERQKQLELERQREAEREKELELELERQKQLELERQQEAERQKQLELERQREAERQKQLELERQREAEQQKQLELERQKQLELERQQEAERQKQLELERQREAERQKQLELERQREAERQKQLELERQREAERQKQLELEMQREAERQKQLELERQREAERQKQLELERQREAERQKQLELERQREAERQKQLELERQREAERQKQLELERQREAERQKQLELERQKQLELERQQEAERQKQLELERQREAERQKQLELERQREAERQKQLELERQREAERQKQLELERQREAERQKQLELERQREAERQKQLELERQREAERQKQLELERQREAERQKQLELERQREAERQKQLELERQREAERQQQLELERQREAKRQKQLEVERQKQLELERQREAERQKKVQEDKERQHTHRTPPRGQIPIQQSGGRESDVSPVDEKVVYDDFSVKSRRWGYMRNRKSSMDTAFRSSQSLAPDDDDEEEEESDENYGQRWGDQRRQQEMEGKDEDNAERLDNWTKSMEQEREMRDLEERNMNVSGRGSQQDGEELPGRETPLGSSDCHNTEVQRKFWEITEDERPLSSSKTPPQPPSKPAAKGRPPCTQTEDGLRMRSHSMTHRSEQGESLLEGSLARERSRSVHRVSGMEEKNLGSGSRDEEEGCRDTDRLVQETDQYGSLDTTQHTDDRVTCEEPCTPSKPDTPESPSPSPIVDTEPLPFPETPTSLLDSSALRSRVQLYKRRRSQRAPPSREARHRAVQQEGSDAQWRFHDSAEKRAEAKMEEDSESEEETRAAELCVPASQPQRVPLFAGIDPSVLKAQLKKRGNSDSMTEQTQATSPRSSKSPFFLQATRVLPPVGGKENSGESSPQWLQKLKSKKAFSQNESDI